jgi:hypothetical protein
LQCSNDANGDTTSFVKLLNRNEVDISSSPLDSYSDGEDMEEEDREEEEYGEDEEGDNELEEIEEGVFDGSQPPKKNRQKRTTNYTEIEDTSLVWAWSSVTIDSVIGNDQTGKRYWQRTEDKFCKLMPRVATLVTHSYRSLQGRWDAIKASCSRWCGALEQLRNAPPSGVGIDVKSFAS